MNYQRIYRQIVRRGQNRIIEGYSENHHIIPKCMGGIETVPLTAKEHFICHLLLTRMFPNNKKVWYAFWNMINGRGHKRKYRVSSILYENCKIKRSEYISEFLKGKKHSEESREKMSENSLGRKNGMYGKKHSKESKLKMSKSLKGRKLSEEWKKKLSDSHSGKTLSEEHKKNISKSTKGENNPMFGREQSEESRKKISESLKGKKQKMLTCPYCNKSGGVVNMKRYHFDKCKKRIYAREEVN